MKKKLVRITTIPISLEKLLGDQLSYMNNFFHVIAVSSNKEKLKKYGISESVDTYHLDLTRKITPFRDLLSLIRLYKFLKREKPFIVHTHTPKAGIVGMLASYLANVPHRLHTVAGLPLLESSGFKRLLLNLIEVITYKCSTKVYPNSFGLKDIILKNKFTSNEKIKVIGNGSSNGINTSYFDPKLFSEKERESIKANLGIGKGDFVFIFVGRVVRDKGINELIKVFDLFSKKNKKIKLLIVGDFEDDLDPVSDDTKKRLNNNKNIFSLGFQKDVRPFLAISNTLVFPSYREGFPNVVMQSGAMNLPCIVSDINGCNEIIKSGYNGIIIPNKDINSLKRAMKRIYEDKKLYFKLKKNSRINIVNNYQQKFYWNALLSEYKSL